MSEVQASLSQVERQLTNSDLQLAFIQLNQKLTQVRYGARPATEPEQRKLKPR